MNKENKTQLVLFIYIIVILVTLFAFMKLINYKYSIWTLIGYIATVLVLNAIFEKKGGKVAQLVRFLSYPLGLLYFLLSLISGFITLYLHLFSLFIVISSVPVLTYFILKSADLGLTDKSLVYILLTFIMIIGVVFFKASNHITKYIGAARLKSSEKMKKLGMNEKVDEIFTREHFRYSLYFFYSLFLVYYSWRYFQYPSEIDESIFLNPCLFSFLTFLGFDALVVNSGLINISAARILEILKSGISKFSDMD